MQNVLCILGLVSLIIAWLLPGHYLPWPTYQQQWIASLGLLLLTLAALSGRATRGLRCGPIAVFFTCLALVPILQIGCGQLRFESDGLLPAFYIVGLGIAMAVGGTLAEQLGQRWIDLLMLSFAFAGSISTAVALLQWLQLGSSIFLADMPPGGRPFGNLGQPNHLATLLCLSVTGVLLAFERRQIGALTCSTVLLWLGFGIVMSQSRTTWLYAAVLVAWRYLMRDRVPMRHGMKEFMLSITVFIGGTVAWLPLNKLLLLASSGAADRFQTDTRWLNWTTLLDAGGKSPWTGYGFLQVGLAHQTTALMHRASHEMLQDSHNIILDLVIWAGIPFALTVVCVVVVWMRLNIRRCHDASCWLLLAAIFAILNHSMLEYPLNFTYFLFPLGLLMGSVEGMNASTTVMRLARSTLIGPVAALAVMLAWVGKECVDLEVVGRQLRFSAMGVKGADGAAALADADIRILDAPREYLRFWTTPAREGLNEEQLSWMRDVSKRNASPPAMLRFAVAAGLNHHAEESHRTLALICKLHSEERCVEAKRSWSDAQRLFPQLRPISAPE